jgi:hypothetical protein
MYITKEFFEEYLEIHYDIVEAITFETHHDNPCTLLGKIIEEKGTGGLYELSKELTDKFVTQYKDVIWGEELEYQDTMVEFLKINLYGNS